MSKEMRHGMMRTLRDANEHSFGWFHEFNLPPNCCNMFQYPSRFFKLVYAEPFNMMQKNQKRQNDYLCFSAWARLCSSHYGAVIKHWPRHAWGHRCDILPNLKATQWHLRRVCLGQPTACALERECPSTEWHWQALLASSCIILHLVPKHNAKVVHHYADLCRH